MIIRLIIDILYISPPTISNCPPPQLKGRVPLYNRDKLVDLQNIFDSLEDLKIFGKPEDYGICVENVNPSFLVKKSDVGFRLVTSFGEVAKHCKPVPRASCQMLIPPSGKLASGGT